VSLTEDLAKQVLVTKANKNKVIKALHEVLRDFYHAELEGDEPTGKMMDRARAALADAQRELS
jgi:hypothetical protein